MKAHTVISTVVKANINQAWVQLWRKAYETKDFVPGLTSLTIHDKKQDIILRTMELGPMKINEIIVKDNSTKTVYFHNTDDSDVHGLIYNRLYQDHNGNLILQFGSDAYNKEKQPAPPLQLFNKALNITKDVMEK